MVKSPDVHKVLSAHGGGLLTYAAFTEGLELLNVKLEPQVTNELFSKADTDMNGVISVQEFHKFSENFPTLIDCLYHRSRDVDNERSYKQQETDAIAALKAAMTQEQRAREDQQRAAEETSRFEAALASQKDRTAKLKEIEQKQRTDLGAMRQSVEAQKSEMFDLKVATKGCRTDAVQHRSNASLLETKAAQLEHDAAETGSELQNAVSRLKAIEQMLLEQQQVVGKLQENNDRITQAMQQSRDEAAQQLLLSQQKDEAANEQEAAVAAREEAIRAAEHECYEAIASLKRAEAATMAEAQREHEDMTHLSRIRDKEIAANQALEQAVQRVESSQRSIESTRDARHQYTTKRVLEHGEEMILLREEIELRRQRDTLVEQEQSLRDSFAQFSRDSSGTPARVVPPSSPASVARSVARMPPTSPVATSTVQSSPAGRPVHSGLQGPPAARSRLSVGRPTHSNLPLPRVPAAHASQP